MVKMTNKDVVDALSGISERISMNPDTFAAANEKTALSIASVITAGWNELRTRLMMISEASSPNQDYMAGRTSVISAIDTIMTDIESRISQ